MVVVTFKFSNPLTLILGIDVEVLTVKLGDGRGSNRRGDEGGEGSTETGRKKNIVVQVAKAVDEKAPIKAQAEQAGFST